MLLPHRFGKGGGVHAAPWFGLLHLAVRLVLGRLQNEQ